MKTLIAFLSTLILIACGKPDNSMDWTSGYTVSYTITGIPQGGEVLITHDVNVLQNGTFVFPHLFQSGDSYNIFVLQTFPQGLSCTVITGNGVIYGSNITNIQINCISEEGY